MVQNSDLKISKKHYKMENEDIYEKAHKRVKAKKGFFYHFSAYVLTLAMLYAIMHFENNGEILPVIIVALSWGIGLAAHYLSVFGTENLEILGINSNWEEEELEKELAKLTRKRELKDQIGKEKYLLNEYEKLELKEIIKRPLDEDLI
ncbi:MAG: hypothetical protein ACI86M_003663 [Saprospiraceae bacterium]|jgi:hypothetical protein